MSTWDIIKRFLIGWAAVWLVITIISLVKYREYIGAAVGDNLWAVVYAGAPVILIVLAVIYCLKSLKK